MARRVIGDAFEMLLKSNDIVLVASNTEPRSSLLNSPISVTLALLVFTIPCPLIFNDLLFSLLDFNPSKLSLTERRGVLFYPGPRLGALSPDIVLKFTLDTIDVANDQVLLSKKFPLFNAVLVMRLNLVVLVGIEVLEVIFFVCPDGI